MREIALSIYQVEIGICLILSIIFFKKGTRSEKCLVPFFISILFVESYCRYLDIIHAPVTLIYGIYNAWFPLEFIFFFFFISTFVNSGKKRKFIRYSIIIYLLILLFFYVFILDLKQFATPVFLIGVLFLLSVLFVKIYEIMNDEIMQHPLKNPLFWFITGLLIENIGGFFVMGSVNYLLVQNKSLLSVLGLINILSLCFQYLFFIFYFYCKWRFQK